MPLYCFRCPSGHTFEHFLLISERNDSRHCPQCHAEAGRDYVAEAGGTTRGGDPVEQFSEAAGVHPSQVAECKKHFPHHEFHADGRMIFRGQKHKERCLRDIGFVEHDKTR